METKLEFVQPWSWQTDAIRNEVSSRRDIVCISRKKSNIINLAIGLSCVPLVHLFAVGLFLYVAYKLHQQTDSGAKNLAKDFLAMAGVTTIGGFVPLAMPLIFGIGTFKQSPSKDTSKDVNLDAVEV